MDLLKSIEEIEPHQVFNTGCKPLLVHCSDLNFYVVKYNTGHTSADRLLREFITAAFLRLWHLSVPNFEIVKLSNTHVPKSLGIGHINFKTPCFGSLYNRNYKEVDYFLSEMSVHQRKKFTSPEEFLAIAFFDILIGNEDRHPGNYNLLITAEDPNYHFVPIDHESCFHTGNQHRENYTISWEESILSSPLLMTLFKVSELKNQTFLAGLQGNWYLYFQSCKSTLLTLLSSIPDEWLIDTSKIHSDISKFMFSDEWYELCWQTFLHHIQRTITHSNYDNSL